MEEDTAAPSSAGSRVASKPNRPFQTGVLSASHRLAEAAAHVLHSNDNGVILVAAPELYPHQWSWDAAFITVGLGAPVRCPERLRSCRGYCVRSGRPG